MDLRQLQCGDFATLVSFENLDIILRKRLESMGITEGCKVCMKQKTFFGGPCIIDCEGKKISLRLDDAKEIEVNAYA